MNNRIVVVDHTSDIVLVQTLVALLLLMAEVITLTRLFPLDVGSWRRRIMMDGS